MCVKMVPPSPLKWKECPRSTHPHIHCPAAASTHATHVHLSCPTARPSTVQHRPGAAAAPCRVQHTTGTAPVCPVHHSLALGGHLTELAMPPVLALTPRHTTAPIAVAVLSLEVPIGKEARPTGCEGCFCEAHDLAGRLAGCTGAAAGADNAASGICACDGPAGMAICSIATTCTPRAKLQDKQRTCEPWSLSTHAMKLGAA
jgi:hypothetical protein